MNRKIAKRIRVSNCSECRLCEGVEERCITASGPEDAEILVVGKQPNSQNYQSILEADLREAGIDTSKVAYSSAVKCVNWDIDARPPQIKACKPYLDAEIEMIKPRWVLTMGNEALSAVAGKSGIMKYRGQKIEREGMTIVPTISPMAVSRNPGQRQSYIADLNFFASTVAGKGADIPPPKLTLIDDVEKLKKLKKLLLRASALTFDIETSSNPPGDEFAPDAVIVSIAGAMQVDDRLMVWALPLSHPQSPFRKSWQRVLRFLSEALCGVPRLIAHNGKYDCRWLRHFGVPIELTFDTMLGAHLLNENLLKRLEFQVQNRFGVENWKISTKSLLDEPLSKVLKYNGQDAYYTHHLYLDIKADLAKQPRLARIFKLLMMPANNILVDVERTGVWMDREKLATNTKIAFDTRARIEDELMQFVPDQSLWPTDSKGKPRDVNFNASVFLRWLLFEHLKLPVINRGKEKADGREGDPSVAEDVMLELRVQTRHPIVDLLLERVKWQKYCSAFLTAYADLLDENDRIHTTFKLYGTVTGRLSSGKAEQEKIASRAPIRGVNLQQVPRDPFIRGLFGAPPGRTFVEADFSQVELRIVAFLSRDKTMMRIYQMDGDIHRETAAWVLGVPPDQISKDDRKKAKAVNFGFVYGMYPKKFVWTAFTKYDVVFSLQEAERIRENYFDRFRGLQPWHNRQKRLVREYRRVQSPIGRIRHLPDIDSAEKGVRMEAERQAINSPVQSFGSDLTMLSMIEVHRKFQEHEIDGLFICTVHDALLFDIADHDVARALPIIKETMENPPLERKFGIYMDVPIKVDIQVGRAWGEARELTEEEIYNYGA